MYAAVASFFIKIGAVRFWREAVMALLLSIIVYQNISDTRYFFWADTLPNLRKSIIVQEYELERLVNANETLTSVIEDRNAEISRWSSITAQLENNTSKLQDEISGISIKANERIRTVIQQTIPETCTAAFEYLRDAIPELNYGDSLDFEEVIKLP